MKLEEVAKHNARRQTLKVLEHLREARQKLALVYDHLYLVTGVPQCKTHCELFTESVGFVYSMVDVAFNRGVQLSHELRDLMENPNEKPPPISGRFLYYSDMTPLQRQMIRDGNEIIAKQSKNAIPSHYYTEPAPEKPITICTDLNPVRLKRKPRVKRNEMPL
jgi:hypothetical protein